MKFQGDAGGVENLLPVLGHNCSHITMERLVPWEFFLKVNIKTSGEKGLQSKAEKMFLIYLYLSALGLRCFLQAFSRYSEPGQLFIVVVHGLLIVVASLIAEYRLWVLRLQYLQYLGSVVVRSQA